jgi:lysyl-tRNA synthetase class 2
MSGPDKKNEVPEEHHLIAQRRQKLDEMRKDGFNYPNDRRRTSVAGELHANYESHSTESLDDESVEISIGGRLMAKRVMGKAAFGKVQDRTGQMQIYVQRDVVSADVYKFFKSWDLGDLVWVSGTLFKTRTGELTVNAAEIVLLSKCLRPLPEKFHGLADQELRYRRRYLDLIVNEESRRVFKARTDVVQHFRSYLDVMGFMEVETPMMQAIPGGAVARPFITHHNALDRDLYLRIAPELYLKRLVVGGFERVYEINRSFRNEGVSTQHNPEFTMLELYMAFADYEALMELLENIMQSLALTLHEGTAIDYQGKTYDLSGPFRRLSVVDAVAEYNPDLDAKKLRDVDYLKKVCERLEIKVEKSYGSGKLLIELFEKTVEDRLEDPTFITGFPAEVSPLARRADSDPWLTDRFELFIAGREIANGFSELNDPEDQAERFRAQVEQKDAGDEEAMFYDEDYIMALEYGMPPTAGLGVGIDRLVMLMTDSPSIRDVLLFPHLRESKGDSGS